MTGEQWAATLLDGSVGAILGLVGLFIVFWLTLRADRAHAAQGRTEERLAALLRVLTGIPPRGASTPVVDEWITATRQELVTFALLELRLHQPVGEWAMHVGNTLRRIWELEKSLGRYEGVEELNRTFEYAAWIAAALAMWARGAYNDEQLRDSGAEFRFKGDGLSPESVLEGVPDPSGA